MRTLPIVLPFVLLSACEDRQSFDDRFNDAQEQVENKARKLDKRLEGDGANEQERH